MWQLLVGTSDHMAGLIARATLGLVLFPHGAQKLLGWFGGAGPEATINALGQMGIPPILAMAVIAGETLGALFLIIGFLSRFCALSVGAIMAGAIVMVHQQHGFFMNWFGQQAGEGFEYHLLAIGLALVVFISGGGFASIDYLLTREH